MARASSFWVGIAVGGVVGAVAGLLYAPKPGHEMRGQIKDTSRRAQDKVTNLTQSVKGTAGQAVQSSRDFIEQQRRRVQEAVESGKSAADEKRSEMEAQLQS